MSEAEVLPEPEGGGAPLPPKRPTIIRPAQDGRGPVPARPAPARPAPPPPGARPGGGASAAPKPAAAAGPAVPSSPAAPKRTAGPAPTSGPPKRPDPFAKKPDPPTKQSEPPVKASGKSKSQGSVRKRPEITIVDARPMSQAGFRDMNPGEAPTAEKPGQHTKKDDCTAHVPSVNGGLPAVPGRPPPATSTTTIHSTPPPTEPPPPIPSSRPVVPNSLPPPQPPSPSLSHIPPETRPAEPPIKPSRPTILRPSRPKSVAAAAPTAEQSSEGTSISPPPPLPKRSPIVGEKAGDLMSFEPPPKPARACRAGDEVQSEQKTGEADGDKSEAPVAPKKPTRVSIIRPRPRPKSAVIDGQRPAEKSEESEDASSEQPPPHPKPPPPANRPVAAVPAAPRQSSASESPPSSDTLQTQSVAPPIPVARPRISPREQHPQEIREEKSPATSPRIVRQNALTDENPETGREGSVGGVPDQPRPPVPASRPHGPPSSGPSSGDSSSQSHPSKPPPPGWSIPPEGPQQPSPVLPAKPPPPSTSPVSAPHGPSSDVPQTGDPSSVPSVPAKPPPPGWAVPPGSPRQPLLPAKPPPPSTTPASSSPPPSLAVSHAGAPLLPAKPPPPSTTPASSSSPPSLAVSHAGAPLLPAKPPPPSTTPASSSSPPSLAVSHAGAPLLPAKPPPPSTAPASSSSPPSLAVSHAGAPPKPASPAVSSSPPPGGSPLLSRSSAPSRPAPPASAAPRVPGSHPSGPTGGAGGPPPPLLPSKPPTARGSSSDSDACLYAVSEPLEETDSFTKLPDPSGEQPSRPPPPIPKSRPQAAVPPMSMQGRPLPSVPPDSSDDSLSSAQSHWYEDVDTVRAKVNTEVKVLLDDTVESPSATSPCEESPALQTEGEASEEDIASMYAKINKPRKESNSVTSNSATSSVASGGSTANPFGVKLKHIPESSSSPESEAPPVPPKMDGNNSEVKKPPVLSPKPKPSVLPKPQTAPKPKSPKKEETPEISPQPPTSPKPDPPTQSKPPPVAAKRPTIIRPKKPSTPSTETGAASRDEEDSTDVQMREKFTAPVSRPRSELSGSEEGKSSVVEPPVPAKRPMTVIGFPHQRHTPPESEEKRNLPSPVPRRRKSPEEPSPAEKESERSVEDEGVEDHHSVPDKVGVHPPITRPPPPRPGSRPPQPQQGQGEELAARKQSDSGSGPPRPPSPSPARRPSSSATEVEAAAGNKEENPLPSPTVPLSERETHQPEEEEVRKRPARPSGPPARPMSMPPVKPPLSTVTVPPVIAETSKEKPSRPQPVRPVVPKQTKPTSPPPLPHRPGLSHPLYGYMAGEPHAIAVHDYPASQPDELPFEEGDTVVLLKRVDEQWLMGKVGDKEGIFPQNFVDIIHPLHDELPSSAMDDIIDGMFEEALQEKPDLLQGPRCRARFDFEGEGQGDLAFEDGDVIQLLSHCGDDWLKGELNGNVGMFPASFVEIIEDLPEQKGVHDGLTGGGNEVTCLFDFSGEAGELSFQAGDKIRILSRVNEQWLFGETGGSKGSFPASFVDMVPSDLPHYEADETSVETDTASHSQSLLSAPTSAGGSRKKKFCTALYSFDKGQEGDLEFREGDEIEVVEEVGGDWLKGRLRGKEGIFPASFVQIHSDSSPAAPSGAIDEDHGTGLEAHAGLVTGRALHDFDGQDDQELSFKAGDEIILGSMVSEGSEWQWGELHGKKGMFPASFVEMS